MATVAIIGSRGFWDLEQVRNLVRMLRPETVIITGGAIGVDATAADEAKKRGLEVRIIRPDYATHGRRAPLIRNGDIVKDADYVYAFWDGASRGTRNALDHAEKLGVPYVIVSASTNLDTLEAELRQSER